MGMLQDEALLLVGAICASAGELQHAGVNGMLQDQDTAVVVLHSAG